MSDLNEMATVGAKRAGKRRGQYTQQSLRPSRCEQAGEKSRGGQMTTAFADEAVSSSRLTERGGGLARNGACGAEEQQGNPRRPGPNWEGAESLRGSVMTECRQPDSVNPEKRFSARRFIWVMRETSLKVRHAVFGKDSPMAGGPKHKN